jgi:hypothetical protein
MATGYLLAAHVFADADNVDHDGCTYNHHDQGKEAESSSSIGTASSEAVVDLARSGPSTFATNSPMARARRTPAPCSAEPRSRPR